jgi:hypothetical protein
LPDGKIKKGKFVGLLPLLRALPCFAVKPLLKGFSILFFKVYPQFARE